MLMGQHRRMGLLKMWLCFSQLAKVNELSRCLLKNFFIFYFFKKKRQLLLERYQGKTSRRYRNANERLKKKSHPTPKSAVIPKSPDLQHMYSLEEKKMAWYFRQCINSAKTMSRCETNQGDETDLPCSHGGYQYPMWHFHLECGLWASEFGSRWRLMNGRGHFMRIIRYVVTLRPGSKAISNSEAAGRIETSAARWSLIHSYVDSTILQGFFCYVGSMYLYSRVSVHIIDL